MTSNSNATATPRPTTSEIDSIRLPLSSLYAPDSSPLSVGRQGSVSEEDTANRRADGYQRNRAEGPAIDACLKQENYSESRPCHLKETQTGPDDSPFAPTCLYGIAARPGRFAWHRLHPTIPVSNPPADSRAHASASFRRRVSNQR